ncbi:MAG: hypothetical protein HDS40_05055 [Bacteroides sp.]|nr:hypothetical protein [Bacteroides sp.]
MSQSSSSRRNHLVAMLITVFFHAAIVVVLMTLAMRYTPDDRADRTWPPVDSSEVLFGGEFVMTGDSPEQAENNMESAPAEQVEPTPPAPLAESRENTGTPSPQPAPVITSNRPSPAKVIEEKPAEPTGPTKAEIEAAERAKREAETRQKIADRVKFGSAGVGASGSGKAGSTNGNSNSGVLSGTPGFNLKGRSLASWQTPPSAPLGTITVRVSVNRQGQVTEASYQSGTGAAAANVEARSNCVKAARASRFSVDSDAPAIQTGTITYRFN